MENNRDLPQKISLEDYGGDYHRYIDAIYEVFKNDFIIHKTTFGSCQLNLKFNPIFKDRAYTFYHMTHKGEIENEREPDLRRCECIPWARPAIEKTEEWELKIWEQERGGKHRICIWLDNCDDIDYFVILDVRSNYILLWTAFVSEYNHDTRKKEKEYNQWLKENNNKRYSPNELVAKIRDSIIKEQRSPK
ncbi:MAG: hypothetical protein H6Q15_197 [Bacteroidetes bacterium]|nr:hypothetical protein [Bacteroidota bacterium]